MTLGPLAVVARHVVSPATLTGLKVHFPGSWEADGPACLRVPGVCMTLCLPRRSKRFAFQCTDLFIDYVYMPVPAGKRLGWRFKHVHTHGDMQTQIDTHARIAHRKRTSKRVPGIVTFHISFKSMKDYSPPVRKEERRKKNTHRIH